MGYVASWQIVLVLSASGSGAAAAPQTFDQLWSDVDPRAEALDVEVLAKWADGPVVLRRLRYAIGTIKGRRAWMAAFYAHPAGARRRPGLLHMHGGGQRASLRQVRHFAGRGYACLSVNWGGRPMEGAPAGEANTDWGAVDPTQKNVPGYFSLLPGPKSLDAVASPRNCNWYLLTIGCRRGLTFLERREEVDPNRLGIYGHSMGGNLTTYVAGADDRVRVAVASAGGQGFRTFPRPLLAGWRAVKVRGDLEWFRRTMAFQSYARRIRCAFLHLGATNDFHGIMDDVFRTNALIPHKKVRCSFAPHFNHRFGPAQAVTRALWIDEHLAGTFHMPKTPETTWSLRTPDGVPLLTVRPDASRAIEAVDVYYAIDADPRARFWRAGRARKVGSTWRAALPVLDAGSPLFAFANVLYRLAKPVPLAYGETAKSFCLSSALHVASGEQLRRAGVKATDRPSAVIDDFRRGFHDWYVLSAGNPHHWQYWTRKVTDPKWRGPAGARLSLSLTVAEDNTLVLVAVENEWRGYRGRRKTYVAAKAIKGSAAPQTVVLNAGDFAEPGSGGSRLTSWQALDQLGIRAYYEGQGGNRTPLVGSKRWRGPQPKLVELKWLP